VKGGSKFRQGESATEHKKKRREGKIDFSKEGGTTAPKKSVLKEKKKGPMFPNFG